MARGRERGNRRGKGKAGTQFGNRRSLGESNGEFSKKTLTLLAKKENEKSRKNAALLLPSEN